MIFYFHATLTPTVEAMIMCHLVSLEYIINKQSEDELWALTMENGKLKVVVENENIKIFLMIHNLRIK
mgnify:CR=1 FL=1